VALRLAARGYEVLVTDVDEAGAQATADAIGERAWAMQQDVRDPESHRAVARAAAERGPVEVWVNNAGVLRTEKTWEHSDDDVRLMVEANLLGVFWGARAAVDAMRSGRPHHQHGLDVGLRARARPGGVRRHEARRAGLHRLAPG
jgi:NAD(P)-dependent dehydrogenase (short-subunit alcohol dehydrogenase family)